MTDSTILSERYDAEIFDLIPHRPPMLLINSIHSLQEDSSSSLVLIDEQTPFFEQCGVPSWLGLEYMGQTAALIAGLQRKRGLIAQHTGLLLGTRRYLTSQEYFSPHNNLLVECNQIASVGDSLAKFDCTIYLEKNKKELASAILSVFRKAYSEFSTSEK